jgi:hypothetical protein
MATVKINISSLAYVRDAGTRRILRELCDVVSGVLGRIDCLEKAQPIDDPDAGWVRLQKYCDTRGVPVRTARAQIKQGLLETRLEGRRRMVRRAQSARLPDDAKLPRPGPKKVVGETPGRDIGIASPGDIWPYPSKDPGKGISNDDPDPAASGMIKLEFSS